MKILLFSELFGLSTWWSGREIFFKARNAKQVQSPPEKKIFTNENFHFYSKSWFERFERECEGTSVCLQSCLKIGKVVEGARGGGDGKITVILNRPQNQSCWNRQNVFQVWFYPFWPNYNLAMVCTDLTNNLLLDW